jgi:hypothetical protein
MDGMDRNTLNKEVRVMMINDYTTFNNISVISWLSVLLVDGTRVPEKPPTCPKSLTNFIT